MGINEEGGMRLSKNEKMKGRKFGGQLMGT